MENSIKNYNGENYEGLQVLINFVKFKKNSYNVNKKKHFIFLKSLM